MYGADDAPFGASVGADVSEVDEDEISVHGVADLVRRDEDVAGQFRSQRGVQRFCVGDNEAESVAVHGEASGDEVLVGGGLRKRIAVGVDGNQRTSFNQLLEMLGEFAALVPMQSEFAEQLLVSSLMLGLAG